MVGIDLANMSPSLAIHGSSLSSVQLETLGFQRSDIMYLASFLAELVLMEYVVAFYPPSVLAASIVRLSMIILCHPPWPRYAAMYSGLAIGDAVFDDCFNTVRNIFRFYIRIAKDPSYTPSRASNYRAVARKYKLLSSLNVHLHISARHFSVAPQA